MIAPMRKIEKAAEQPPPAGRILLEIDEAAYHALSISVLAHHYLGISNSAPVQLAKLILLAMIHGQPILQIGLIHVHEEKPAGGEEAQQEADDEDCPW